MQWRIKSIIHSSKIQFNLKHFTKNIVVSILFIKQNNFTYECYLMSKKDLFEGE